MHYQHEPIARNSSFVKFIDFISTDRNFTIICIVIGVIGLIVSF